MAMVGDANFESKIRSALELFFKELTGQFLKSDEYKSVVNVGTPAVSFFPFSFGAPAVNGLIGHRMEPDFKSRKVATGGGYPTSVKVNSTTCVVGDSNQAVTVSVDPQTGWISTSPARTGLEIALFSKHPSRNSKTHSSRPASSSDVCDIGNGRSSFNTVSFSTAFLPVGKTHAANATDEAPIGDEPTPHPSVHHPAGAGNGGEPVAPDLGKAEDGPFDSEFLEQSEDAPASSKVGVKSRPVSIEPHCANHFPHDPSCEGCVRARLQARAKTRSGGLQVLVDEPLRRVHLDTMGPTEEALHGEKYVLVAWDEGSEYLKCLPILDKVPVHVRDAFIRGFSGERKKVVMIRCDNGGEFMREFETWCKDQGIGIEHSLPGRPSTNSRIEDKVRRVKEGTTAVMIVSCSPYIFWSFACVMWAKSQSMSRLNRHGKTPYFSLRNRDPIRPVTFGIRGYYLDPVLNKMHDRKFDPRGRNGVVLGYSLHKALVFLDLDHYVRSRGEVRTCITRDYRLVEGNSPFRDMKDSHLISEMLHRRLFVEVDKGEAAVLADEEMRCFICHLSLEMVEVLCPGCRGRHRKHNDGPTCFRNRCRGHTVADAVAAAQEQDEIEKANIIMSLGRSDNYLLTNYYGLRDAYQGERKDAPVDNEAHDENAADPVGLPPRRRLQGKQPIVVAPPVPSAPPLTPGPDPSPLVPRAMRFSPDVGGPVEPEVDVGPATIDEDEIPPLPAGNVEMSTSAIVVSGPRTFCTKQGGRIVCFDSPFGPCVASAIVHVRDRSALVGPCSRACFCTLSESHEVVPEEVRLPALAMVHKLILPGSPEWNSEAVRAAIKKEEDNIISRKVWDPKKPREKSDVMVEFPDAVFLMGHVIVSAKNFEIPEIREMKARVVGNGGQVRNIFGELVNAADIYTLPCSFSSFRTCAAVVHCDGGDMIQFDVCAAYLQAIRRHGPPTWIRPPRQMFTEEMRAMREPVVKLDRWIYGEQGASDGWSDHFHEALVAQGWTLIESCGGESIYIRDNVVLGVYVDDGSAGHKGPRKTISFILELRGLIEMKDPSWLKHFLGLHVLRAFRESYRYCIIAQKQYAEFILNSYIRECGGSIKRYANPGLSHKDALVLLGGDSTLPGIHAPSSKGHIGSLMFLTRGSRSDLCQSVCSLSKKVASWCTACDKRLARIFGYLSTTVDFVTVFSAPENCDIATLKIDLESDSDHAGDVETSKSTSGAHCALVTPGESGAFCPVDWFSKSQTVVAISTAQAEIGAASDACMRVGYPTEGLVEAILNRTPEVEHGVDNDACRQVCVTGASKALRYMVKQQRIRFHFMKETYSPKLQSHRVLKRVDTAKNRSDYLTKALSNEAFCRHRMACGVMSLSEFHGFLVDPGDLMKMYGPSSAVSFSAAVVACPRRLVRSFADPRLRRVFAHSVACLLRKTHPSIANMIDQLLNTAENVFDSSSSSSAA